MSEKTKQQVLAQCQDLKEERGQWRPIEGSELPLCRYVDEMVEWFQIGSPSHFTCLRFNEQVSPDCEVWDIAAGILKIKRNPEESWEPWIFLGLE